MQLIIVTGLSGGGKSIAIRQLEDSGFYCIDNLPAEFLLPIAENLEKNGTRAAAVAIDARSHATFENAFTALEALSQRGIDVRILFLTASNEELLRRFSETRRRHPLSTLAEHQGRELTLNEAIAREREIMAPVTETAHVLDTTRLLPSQLRRWVQQFVKQPAAKLTLTFESFGYKRGLPYASDLVFDVRCLPNPYYSPELRPLTGLDAPVASYLAQEPLVSEMIDDIAAFIAKWLPHYRGQNRHYLTICIGCTGGQHRSVYVAEMLGRRFADQAGTIVRHRALSANLLPENKLQTLSASASLHSRKAIFAYSSTGVGSPGHASGFSPKGVKPSVCNASPSAILASHRLRTARKCRRWCVSSCTRGLPHGCAV